MLFAGNKNNSKSVYCALLYLRGLLHISRHRDGTMRVNHVMFIQINLASFGEH